MLGGSHGIPSKGAWSELPWRRKLLPWRSLLWWQRKVGVGSGGRQSSQGGSGWQSDGWLEGHVFSVFPCQQILINSPPGGLASGCVPWPHWNLCSSTSSGDSHSSFNWGMGPSSNTTSHRCKVHMSSHLSRGSSGLE